MSRRPRVVCTPGVMSGDPCIEGTRVLAKTIAAEIAAGRGEADIRRHYPTLPPGSVEAVKRWLRERS